MQKIGLVGYGEIGIAIKECYNNIGNHTDIGIKDTNKNINQLKGTVDLLHICIPYIDNKQFINAVVHYIKKYTPSYTIIHSTTPPGTTKSIISETNNNVVHSPIRGVHPYLYEGIKTFVKYIGGENNKAAKWVKQHYDMLGIKSKIFANSVSTELAKLLSTTYYGMCIAFHHDINEACKKLGVSFDEVATQWNTSYNEGYKNLGMNHVTRPVLYPPKNGKISGHCIIPNAELCMEFIDSKIVSYIANFKEQ